MTTKNKDYDVDILLKKALSSSETPDADLIYKIKHELIKEEPILKRSFFGRSFSLATAVVVAMLLLTTTVFAAWYFLKPSEIADRFEDQALSAAFESDTAININKSITAGDYIFTLLAVVSGKDITDMPYYSENTLQDERTYAVVAIQNIDGTPMPSTQDADYGKVPFFASPLIKGLEPWRYNVVSMNGGYYATVVDGITYRIVECDNVALFADRGLYFAMSTDTFYNRDAFIWNEETGEIKANPDYTGASAVFDLPISASMADPEKAEQYLNSLLDSLSQPPTDELPPEAALWDAVNWDEAVPVASTIKELVVNNKGEATYEYDFDLGSGSVTININEYFVHNSTTQSAIVSQMASDDDLYAIRVTMDESGGVTGMVVLPKE